MAFITFSMVLMGIAALFISVSEFGVRVEDVMAVPG